MLTNYYNNLKLTLIDTLLYLYLIFYLNLYLQN